MSDTKKAFEMPTETREKLIELLDKKIEYTENLVSQIGNPIHPQAMIYSSMGNAYWEIKQLIEFNS